MGLPAAYAQACNLAFGLVEARLLGRARSVGRKGGAAAVSWSEIRGLRRPAHPSVRRKVRRPGAARAGAGESARSSRGPAGGVGRGGGLGAGSRGLTPRRALRSLLPGRPHAAGCVGRGWRCPIGTLGVRWAQEVGEDALQPLITFQLAAILLPQPPEARVAL